MVNKTRQQGPHTHPNPPDILNLQMSMTIMYVPPLNQKHKCWHTLILKTSLSGCSFNWLFELHGAEPRLWCDRGTLNPLSHRWFNSGWDISWQQKASNTTYSWIYISTDTQHLVQTLLLAKNSTQEPETPTHVSSTCKSVLGGSAVITFGSPWCCAASILVLWVMWMAGLLVWTCSGIFDRIVIWRFASLLPHMILDFSPQLWKNMLLFWYVQM